MNWSKKVDGTQRNRMITFSLHRTLVAAPIQIIYFDGLFERPTLRSRN